MTDAIRMLAYETLIDANDSYVNIDESTVIESLRGFVKVNVEIFNKTKE